MVHITPLPNAPDIVLGVVNMQGRVIPVMNIRQRFNLPKREIALTDQLIFAHTERRPVALVADTVTEVAEWSGKAGSRQRKFFRKSNTWKVLSNSGMD